MEFRFITQSPLQSGADALILPVYQTDDGKFVFTSEAIVSGALLEQLIQIASDARFEGKVGTTYSSPTLGALPTKRVVLAGLGTAAEVNRESIRKAWGAAARAARNGGAVSIVSALPPEVGTLTVSERIAAATEAVGMALYEYREYFGTVRNATAARVVEQLNFCGEASETEANEGIKAGQAVASGVNLARDLSNKPASDLTPSRMAEIASDVASDNGLEIKVYGVKELAEIGSNAILTVGKGSANEPCLIHLIYRPETSTNPDRKIGLVGKCITFDSGGYSIKTTEGMVEMKGDMSGGSAVLGAMSALRNLDMPHEVHGVICAAENMISGEAFRPGDVITGMNGVTMEIISTDAEGRLVLADGLVFTARQGVTEMVDLATLTGAKVVALGNETVAMFSNNDELGQSVLQAAETAGESMWRMPLSKHMMPQIKGSIADIRNSGGRAGGSITAALFLEHFCEDAPWAHLDIAGANRAAKTSGYTPAGATGVGVRTLLEYVNETKTRKSG